MRQSAENDGQLRSKRILQRTSLAAANAVAQEPAAQEPVAQEPAAQEPTDRMNYEALAKYRNPPVSIRRLYLEQIHDLRGHLEFLQVVILLLSAWILQSQAHSLK